jgi:hypothetical protein
MGGKHEGVNLDESQMIPKQKSQPHLQPQDVFRFYNLKTFFVSEKFKNANSSRKDRDTMQMHLLKIAMHT